MATLNSPVELPTSRHSFVEFPMTANIKDPTSWDALNNGNTTRGSSKLALTSEHPIRTSASKPRPSSRGQQSILSKPSPAMETPPQELEAPVFSYFPPRGSSAQATWSDQTTKNNTSETLSDTGHETQASDDYTGSTRSASTTGTNSLQENQVYSIPGSFINKDDTVSSPVLASNRSTTNSVKKSGVPTSKYKKKPPPSLRSSVKRKSGGETPVDSPLSTFAPNVQPPTPSLSIASMPSELPGVTSPADFPSPPEPAARSGQAPLQHTKSTASVRKARALHSHPSLPSSRDDVPTSPPLPQPSPNPSTLRLRKSMDTTRSRPSIYELQEPSPAPSAPLPDLPVGVQPLSRRASRDMPSQPAPPPDVHMRPGTSSSSAPPTFRRQDTSPQMHSEMANFMASSSKVIFRRFHDVHIRLLLTLQDEIGALEKELAEIESTEHAIDIEREARRVKVLSELRKLLAEYDHLFANWNLMQSSKADAKIKGELEQFLQRPEAHANTATSSETIDDLLWLRNNGNDLSCVDLSMKKDSKPAVVTQKEVPALPEKPIYRRMPPEVPSSRPLLGGGGGGGAGGLVALLTSCAGKRK